ncbi:MAG: hypothetical protein KJ697_01550 [Nanoarchaeota archaeon]|nr:hypothetical protein [Nanoarchaeota archaeon]MBU4124507.1 hypothetical protein [Nanoarchaeota archaeon]
MFGEKKYIPNTKRDIINRINDEIFAGDREREWRDREIMTTKKDICDNIRYIQLSREPINIPIETKQNVINRINSNLPAMTMDDVCRQQYFEALDHQNRLNVEGKEQYRKCGRTVPILD